jgi:hypothetical protein
MGAPPTAQSVTSAKGPQPAARRGALTAAWSTQEVAPFSLQTYKPV